MIVVATVVEKSQKKSEASMRFLQYWCSIVFNLALQSYKAIGSWSIVIFLAVQRAGEDACSCLYGINHLCEL